MSNAHRETSSVDEFSFPQPDCRKGWEGRAGDTSQPFSMSTDSFDRWNALRRTTTPRDHTVRLYDKILFSVRSMSIVIFLFLPQVHRTHVAGCLAVYLPMPAALSYLRGRPEIEVIHCCTVRGAYSHKSRLVYPLVYPGCPGKIMANRFCHGKATMTVTIIPPGKTLSKGTLGR